MVIRYDCFARSKSVMVEITTDSYIHAFSCRYRAPYGPQAHEKGMIAFPWVHYHCNYNVYYVGVT